MRSVLNIMLKIFRSVIFSYFGLLVTTPLANSQGDSKLVSAPTYFRKLGYHLKGRSPQPREFSELALLKTEEERQVFLNNKINEYLQTADAADRMVYLLSERFQIKTPDLGLETYSKLSDPEKAAVGNTMAVKQDSLVDIFGRLIRENLSWDYLLTGKDYNLFKPPFEAFFSSDSDFDFFRLLDPKIPVPVSEDKGFGVADKELGTGFPVHFDSEDLRVSGVLTTPRFLIRYNTTNVNKNRRRAAAVFRIFLCDPMVPVIPPPADKKAAYLKNAFNDDDSNDSATIDHSKVTEEQLMTSLKMSDVVRHGSDPKCAVCHYKLDPMGRTFQNIGSILNPEPAKGTLTYARANHELLKVELNGIGDLGRELVKQPEYVSCQISWLWKQYIGKDIPLTEIRRTELSQQFESVGRRTKDFIKLLVSAPEFKEVPRFKERIEFSQVAQLLKHCDSCHSALPNMPTFSIGGISQEFLHKMKFRLNLPDNSSSKMPRDWMSWNPEELELVKRWVNQSVEPSPSIYPKLEGAQK